MSLGGCACHKMVSDLLWSIWQLVDVAVTRCWWMLLSQDGKRFVTMAVGCCCHKMVRDLSLWQLVDVAVTRCWMLLSQDGKRFVTGSLWMLLSQDGKRFVTMAVGGCCCHKMVVSQLYFSCIDANLSKLPQNLPESTQRLDLSFNPLKYLHAKYFSHLFNLQYLDLTRCSITVIEDLAFSGLGKLKTLLLTGNPVSHWSPLSLFGLPSLERLVVVETSLTSLLHLPIGQLTSLRELNAGSNLLTTLHFARHLLMLHILDLHANNITQIHYNDLENLRGGNTLNLSLILSRNPIRQISPGTFQNVSLRFLKMQGSFSSIEALRENLKAMCGLQVEKLAIGHYRYSVFRIYFQSGLLEGLCQMNIKELSINGMYFQTTNTLFDCLQNVTSLRLVNSDLEIFSSVPNVSSRLQHFELKNSHLLNFPSQVLSMFPSLRKIRITDTSKLSGFNEDSYGLSDLELLDLSKNQLMITSCCEQIVSGMPFLRHLNLSHNVQIDFRSEFLNMSYLLSLNLSHSELVNVGVFPLFLLMGGLKILDLSYTYCHFRIGCSFCGLDNLEWLSVSHSTFSREILGSVFQTLTQLHYLDLSACNLDHIPREAFTGLKLLQVLDLSKNKLLDLQTSLLHPLSALTSLDLSSNHFTGMSENTTRLLSAKTVKVDLSQNPFDCTCSQEIFLQWVQEQKERTLQNTGRMLCNSPKKWKGIRLGDVASDCSVGLTVFAGVLGVILCSLVAIFVYHCYHHKYLHLLCYWCCQNLHAQQGTENEYDAFVIYSTADEEWVKGQLVPELEEGRPPFRLCLHYRDFMPGIPITSNIVNEGLLRSRKALIIVSKNFMQSQWCTFEFEMAKSWQFLDGHAGIIAILLEAVTEAQLKQMLGLHKYLHKNTYLKWAGGPIERRLFWVRLRDALKQGHHRTQPQAANGQPDDL
ncbi:toll-like receptor 4 [Pelodytes ibericus]